MASFGGFLLGTLAVTGLVVAGGFAAARVLSDHSVVDTPCAPPELVPIAPVTSSDSLAASGTKRTRVLAADGALPPGEAGRLVVCVANGDVRIARSSDGLAHVRVTLEERGLFAQRTVSDSRVETAFGQLADAPFVAVTHVAQGVRLPFLSPNGPSAHVLVELPADVAWSVFVTTSVGDLETDGVRVAGGDLRSNVGIARLDLAALTGELAVKTGAGSIDARVRDPDNGTLRVAADAGDVTVRVPETRDVAYDLRAGTEVGAPRIEVDRAERYAPDDALPDESRIAARTPPAERFLHVDARTIVGDATILELPR